MLSCQRALFEIPQDVAYLNAAFMGPLMTEVVAAGHAGVAAKARPWEVGIDAFFDPVEKARGLYAGLTGADVEGIAVVPSVSYGIAVAAANLPLAAGKRVLVLEEQFPSNLYSWRRLAAENNAVVQVVARPANGDWTEALLGAIEPGVAIVACPQAHWSDGCRIDLVAIGAACRAVGAALVIDGTQSFGAMPFDTAAVDPDFAVAATYKWLLGPYSLGFLYVAPRHRNGQPLEEGWICREGSRDFSRLVDYTESMDAGARRFDVGERSNFALMPMAIAAMERLTAWTPAAVSAYAGRLTDRMVAETAAWGCTAAPASARSPHLLGLGLPEGVDAKALATRLAAAQVSVSVRGSRLRISPHVYNTDADVDRLLGVLEDALAKV
ncbi:aminotransferase [Rhodospirillum rubrum]|uniref:aminotransferase class V-fold PLP-dependent enzyme n=1 Tax=Rhodospirillum rubrum TaxID=1085 RepID=UPI001906591D|nr:aminotransferase class V-fold PLP-dependent enzyme [Rhodospirillum rubrum]MBK1665906.1 aminotransferase [Rhodospirillum rubrum]MBK1676831.1 aminotransferase [Rhodospirillum rubrum]